MYIPDNDTAITTTKYLIMTLRKFSVQDITSLLDDLRSQHAHIIKTGKLIGDPNTDYPQSPLTHALYNLARALNIPSSQHSIPIRTPEQHNNMHDTHALQLSVSTR